MWVSARWAVAPEGQGDNDLFVNSPGPPHPPNSSGNIRPQSSQLAEPLWTDHGVKSGMSARELIST